MKEHLFKADWSTACGRKLPLSRQKGTGSRALFERETAKRPNACKTCIKARDSVPYSV